MRGRAVIAVFAVTLLSGCVAPAPIDAPGTLGIPPISLGEGRAAPDPLRGTLRLPPGPGAKPVVIVLHGCNGVSPLTGDWAQRLAEWGYGSLVLDSFAPRRVANVCAADRQRLVNRFDRAADVVATVRWLRTQPGVDPTRLAVIGLSHGGSTAATVTLRPFADEVAGSVKGVVDYYGACRDLPRYSGLPLLAMAGTDDTWSDPAPACAKFMAGAPPGSDIEVVAYPGAVHAFDNPRLTSRRWSETHPLQYDGKAADDSFRRTKAFLDRLIGPPAG